jgi:hypothetical protein
MVNYADAIISHSLLVVRFGGNMAGKPLDTKYVWVKDDKNIEYLCPIDALKEADSPKAGELRECINVDSLKDLVDDL